MTKFLIYSLARSGSTTLMHQLNLHPEIRCLHEPFNPGNPRRVITGGADFPSLDRAVEEIWKSYSGFKHVWDPTGWPFGTNQALNKHLLRRAEQRILFLNRRNILRRLISYEMSRQADVWDASAASRRKVAEFKFQPIDIEWIGRTLKLEKQAIDSYRQVIVASGADFLDLWYEDLFSLADQIGRITALNTIFSFIGCVPVSDQRLKSQLNELFEPNTAKLNSASTYGRIPNAHDIESHLGADDTGWLFQESTG
jgi:hypothetical protein